MDSPNRFRPANLRRFLPSPWSRTHIDLRQWGRYLGETTIAAAILDRLAMHAIRIDIDGPSFRQHVAAERAGKAPVTAAPTS